MRAASTPPLLARWWLRGRAALERSSATTSQDERTATIAAAAQGAASSSSSAASSEAAADPLSASLAERRATAQAAGTWKTERVIRGPQGARVRVVGGGGAGGGADDNNNTKELLNFCANNYLGLSNHPRVVAAAADALCTHGFGLASVRFICGTTDLHVELERRLAQWLGAEDAILFPSCFDANAGVFEALLGPEDAIVSDALNHASIIDGVRLCKAKRFRYAHGDVGELEAALQSARDAGARSTVVVTDGVFSMDGAVAPLDRIVPAVRAAGKGTYLMVDDCHASGFWGATGRGTAEARGLLPLDGPGGGGGGGASGGGAAGDATAATSSTTTAATTTTTTNAPPMMGGVDLLSSTLGKALGGATGGFVCGRADAVAALRQSARPYLFSNTLAPSVAAASLAVLDIVQGEEGDALRARLRRNAALFRGAMEEAGFSLGGGGGGGGGADAGSSPGSSSPHPIVPVMLGDAALASEFARRMLEDKGVYVVAFSFPVVPRGKARIRVQLSAAHSEGDVKACAAAFAAVGRELGVVR